MNSSPVRFSLGGTLWLTILGVLGLGLTITTALFIGLSREARQLDAARFDRYVEDAKQLLETRIERYEVGLSALAQYFSYAETVTQNDWQALLDRLQLDVNYPGLIEIGYAHNYSGNWRREPPEWIMTPAHKRLLPSPSSQPIEQASWPILFHSSVQGFELSEYGDSLHARYQEDWLNDAVPRAYKTANPATSHKRVLRNSLSGSDASAFTFYFASYFRDLSLHTASLTSTNIGVRHRTREDHTKGLLFASVQVDALLDSVFQKAPQSVEFELYAGRAPRLEQWLNDRSKEARFFNPTHRPMLSRVQTIPWYGEVWSLYFYTTPLFDAQSLRYRPWLAVGVGVPVSFLMAGVTWAQARGRAQAERLAESLRRSETHLQLALKERERMSRDLHDGTIQSLYAIGLGLGQLRRSLGNTLQKERLEASLVELDHVVSELRGYLVVLDPGVSPAQTAVAALTELVARLRHTSGTELRLTAVPSLSEDWPPAAVLDLLLTAREGISNALRHGHATEVDLVLQQEASGAVLFSITDNGNGFDTSVPHPQHHGHGLSNLERRARAWNGSICIDSRPGGPTRLAFTLFPLGEKSSIK